MKQYWATDEARATRRARAELAHQQRPDQLAERQRLIRFWLGCAETNRHYLPMHGCWLSVFRTNFRRVLMPGVRAMLDARDAAWERAWHAQMSAHAAAWRQRQAERRAAHRRERAAQRDLVDLAQSGGTA